MTNAPFLHGIMPESLPTTVELKQTHIDFLEAMAKKYDLPDRSKALRCLLNFAMEESEHEASIFTEIRCSGCS